MRPWTRVFIGVILFLAAPAFVLISRPLYLQWGSTPAEQVRSLPGDSVVPQPATQETRAISINAPADVVWRWVAQLGQDRSGFYSFDVLENLVGCRMPIEDGLRPQLQQWRDGDRLWMYPPNRANGIGYASLRFVDPGRALVFGTHQAGTAMSAPEDGSWSFAVEPIDAHRSRLIVRGRAAVRTSFIAAAFDRLFFEPVHFMMERRMMLGIRELAETGRRNHTNNLALVANFVVLALLFAGAGFRALRAQRWTPPLAYALTAGALLAMLVFRQPPALVGLLLTAGLIVSAPAVRLAKTRPRPVR